MESGLRKCDRQIPYSIKAKSSGLLLPDSCQDMDARLFKLNLV